MGIIEALSIIIASVITPYVVALIKRGTIKDATARWLAYGISGVAGVICGLIAGIPASAAEWVTCIFATIGGVQVAYAAFKEVGVTSDWLDALTEIGGTN